MTTNQIKLSYVMTTYNKLPYLKEVMKRLLENVQEDEEIIVTDGASTDGTVEYLTELYNHGKIHQFLSEPDKGEAHGFNKGMLMAKGELIKILSDDDAFHYPSIRKCKNFMLENESFDFLFANAGYISIKHLSSNLIHDISNLIHDINYIQDYRLWIVERKAFIFNGLSIMIRKKSLPLIGLFASDFILVDCEMALRACKLANMALYNGYIAVNINNPSSKFRHKEENIRQLKKLEYFYDWELTPYFKEMVYPKKDSSLFLIYKSFVIRLKKIAKNIFRINDAGLQNMGNLNNSESQILSFSECLLVAEKWLEGKNINLIEQSNIFLTPHKELE